MGIAWFRRENYQRIRAAIADPYNLPPDYDAWLEFAEKIEQTHQRGGLRTVRVDINLESLRIWCDHTWVGRLDNERPRVDTTGCALYAQEIAANWGHKE